MACDAAPEAIGWGGMRWTILAVVGGVLAVGGVLYLVLAYLFFVVAGEHRKY